MQQSYQLRFQNPCWIRQTHSCNSKRSPLFRVAALTVDGKSKVDGCESEAKNHSEFSCSSLEPSPHFGLVPRLIQRANDLPILMTIGHKVEGILRQGESALIIA